GRALELVPVDVIEEPESLRARRPSPASEVGRSPPRQCYRDRTIRMRNPRCSDVLHSKRPRIGEHGRKAVAPLLVGTVHRYGTQPGSIELLAELLRTHHVCPR